MLEKCVVQVLGSLSQYSRPLFRLGDGIGVEAFLSGDALCGLLSGGCKLYLFAPASLAANIVGEPEMVFGAEWFSRLEQVFLRLARDYVSRPEALRIRVLPSTGSYFFGRDKRRILSFKGIDHRDIELVAFIYMMELLGYGSRSEGCDEVIFDFSTGLNLYVLTASRALNSVIVAYKLANLDRLVTGLPVSSPVKVSYVPPIMRGIKGPYDIVLEGIDARLFFNFPLAADKINGLGPTSFIRAEAVSSETKRRIGKKYSWLLKEIKKILKIGLYLHNAVKYNAPLGIYYMRKLNKINPEDLSSEKPLELLSELRNLVFSEAWQHPRISHDHESTTIHFTGANRRITLYTMQALLETSSLIRMHEKLVQGIDLDNGVSIGRIRQDIINGIYSSNPDLAYELALNKRMLERDLEEIMVSSRKLKSNQCMKLAKLLDSHKQYGDSEETRRNTSKAKVASDIKRNFFAHSGLLRNIVEVCRMGNDTLIKYVFNDMVTGETLVRWLSDPS